jgi:hypothetical protein
MVECLEVFKAAVKRYNLLSHYLRGEGSQIVCKYFSLRYICYTFCKYGMESSRLRLQLLT